jgi:hypothetical protein
VLEITSQLLHNSENKYYSSDTSANKSAKTKDPYTSPGMVVRCECDAKKCEKANFFCSCSAMRCDFLIPFSHRIRISHFFAFFALFSHFSHIFLHFLLLFAALIVKHGAKSAKMRKKCEKCDANAKCECDAMRWAWPKVRMRKSFRTTIPAPHQTFAKYLVSNVLMSDEENKKRGFEATTRRTRHVIP